MRTQNKEKIKLAFKQVSDAERTQENGQKVRYALNEDGTLKRCDTPYNPKDETLIDLICQAMTYVAKQKSDKVKFEKSQYRNCITDETLITMLKQRGYIIIKGDIV